MEYNHLQLSNLIGQFEQPWYKTIYCMTSSHLTKISQSDWSIAGQYIIVRQRDRGI